MDANPYLPKQTRVRKLTPSLRRRFIELLAEGHSPTAPPDRGRKDMRTATILGRDRTPGPARNLRKLRGGWALRAEL